MNAQRLGSLNVRFSNEIVYEFDDFDWDFSIRRQESSFPERRVQVVYHNDECEERGLEDASH